MRRLFSILIIFYVFGYLSWLLWYNALDPDHWMYYYLWEKCYIVIAFYMIGSIMHRYGPIVYVPLAVASVRLVYDLLLYFFDVQLNKPTHITILFIVVIVLIGLSFTTKLKPKWLQ